MTATINVTAAPDICANGCEDPIGYITLLGFAHAKVVKIVTAIEPTIAGIPCKLLTPQLSCNPRFFSKNA